MRAEPAARKGTMNILLEKAYKELRTADHMAYVTYPILKEKRLLAKILEGIDSVVRNVIKAILQHEYEYKRVKIYSDPHANLKIFEGSCADRYGIREQIENIHEILTLAEKHKESSMEFVRNNKMIFLSDDLRTESITLEKLKEYIVTAKELMKRAESVMSLDKKYL